MFNEDDWAKKMVERCLGFTDPQNGQCRSVLTCTKLMSTNVQDPENHINPGIGRRQTKGPGKEWNPRHEDVRVGRLVNRNIGESDLKQTGAGSGGCIHARVYNVK
ncbi:hypothetical protein AJ78_02751 [Emergomyces pasteurianus Ep9510]|uniref:Uncharacterized protein n=1 Tax=Emergomyces pasteurianus Ep9510 TaxID=1447872 RepID=A0A1J9QPH2_9EURO|nr:hypothetical protein AJ78_02751 [Emergomyces pasteurianus Ep9510]